MVKKACLFIFLLFLSINLYTTQIAHAQIAAGSSAAPAIQNPKPQDRRVLIIKKFLELYNSPLTPYAQDFVSQADKNGLDWRLLVAISGVESTFGQQIPYNCFNAWGWGIYGDNRLCFKSWNEAIETISKGLKENYIDKWGAQDVYQIGRYYAASPTWAQRVEYFMEKINAFALKDVNSLPISL